MEEFFLILSVFACLFGFTCVGYHMGAYESREYQKCRQFALVETCVKYARLEK